MKNLYIIILFLFLAPTLLLGSEIKGKEVHRFVQNWLLENEYFLHYGKFKNSNETFICKSTKPIRNKNGNILFYVAELNPIGFILISSDNRLNPIIGYSSEKNFDFNNPLKDTFLNDVISDLNHNLKIMD